MVHPFYHKQNTKTCYVLEKGQGKKKENLENKTGGLGVGMGSGTLS